MEIDITQFFNTAAPMDYSASASEIGNDAGAATWAAACEDWEEYPLIDTDDKRDALRAHVRGFGAWTDEEIASWSDVEVNALFLQLISGDIREAGLHPDSTAEDWIEYETNGNNAGTLFRAVDGEVFYHLEG